MGETVLDKIEGGGEPREIRLLRKVADRGAGLDEAHALVGLDEPTGDLHQRRLARAIAADEASPFTGGYRKVGLFDQRSAAESERDVLEGEKRGSSHDAGLWQRSRSRTNAVLPVRLHRRVSRAGWRRIGRDGSGARVDHGDLRWALGGRLGRRRRGDIRPWSRRRRLGGLVGRIGNRSFRDGRGIYRAWIRHGRRHLLAKFRERAGNGRVPVAVPPMALLSPS